MEKVIELGKNVTLHVQDNGKDKPVMTPSQAGQKGRKKGTKIERFVTAEEFIPKYRELVTLGKNWDEISSEFKLSKMTCIQKRLGYNKASADAGHPLNLPAPQGSGTRGAHKIDWSKFVQA